MKRWFLKLIVKALSDTPVLRWIDGHKSEIGLGVTLLYVAVEVLLKAYDAGVCAECGLYAQMFESGIRAAEPYLLELGVTVMGVGVLHNYAKESTVGK